MDVSSGGKAAAGRHLSVGTGQPRRGAPLEEAVRHRLRLPFAPQPFRWTLLLTATCLLGSMVTANAQTTYVTPNYSGGSIVTTLGPGQPPTYVNPNFNGGYTITTPGSG